MILEIAHLTVRQYRESIADLLGSLRGAAGTTESGGLAAVYRERPERDPKKPASENRPCGSVRTMYGGINPRYPASWPLNSDTPAPASLRLSRAGRTMVLPATIASALTSGLVPMLATLQPSMTC